MWYVLVFPRLKIKILIPHSCIISCCFLLLPRINMTKKMMSEKSLTSPEEIYEWKFVICLITYDCFKTNQNYYNTRHFIFQFMSGYTCMKTVEWVFNNKLTFLNLNLTTVQLSTRRCIKIKWIPSFSASGITITEVAEVLHRGG